VEDAGGGTPRFFLPGGDGRVEDGHGSLWEDFFYLSYHGLGITRACVLAMGILERKEHVRRMKRQLDAEAEALKRK
jgi:hypothetical protein